MTRVILDRNYVITPSKEPEEAYINDTFYRSPKNNSASRVTLIHDNT